MTKQLPIELTLKIIFFSTRWKQKIKIYWTNLFLLVVRRVDFKLSIEQEENKNWFSRFVAFEEIVGDIM